MSSKASAGLVAAAISGILLGGACGEDPECPTPQGGSGTGASAPTGGGGAAASGGGGQGAGGKEVLSETEDLTMTFAKFRDECLDRGGFVQTHAVCAGTNSCRGMSYNKFSFVLTEHTCAAMNTCGGISCVVLPEDAGTAPEDFYADHCAGCHLAADVGFVLYVPQGTDTTQAIADLSTKPREALLSAVAFGIHGRNSNGTSARHMPAYYDRYSRAEIERVVEYTLGLDITAEPYGVLGVDEEIEPMP